MNFDYIEGLNENQINDLYDEFYDDNMNLARWCCRDGQTSDGHYNVDPYRCISWCNSVGSYCIGFSTYTYLYTASMLCHDTYGL